MKKPSPRKRSLFSPVPVAMGVALLVFAAWFVFGEAGLWNRHQFRQQRDKQAEEIEFLEAQKKQLTTQLTALKAKDELALETAARNLGLVAQDETIYEIKVAKPDSGK
jgi:cell division protein FtsB